MIYDSVPSTGTWFLSPDPVLAGGIPSQPDVDHVQPVSEQEAVSAAVRRPAGPNQLLGSPPVATIDF